MLRSSPRLSMVLAFGAMLSGAMGGCAGETGGWPRMDDFSRIGQKVLSPQEQDQAIKTMTADQKAEQDKAIETIEKKK